MMKRKQVGKISQVFIFVLIASLTVLPFYGCLDKDKMAKDKTAKEESAKEESVEKETSEKNYFV